MNEHQPEDEIMDMFSHVERRPSPPPEALDRAYAAVEREWESVMAARRRRSQRRRLAAAAAVVLAAAGTWLGLQVTTAPSPQAWLVQGDVTIAGQPAPVPSDPVTPLQFDPQADIVSRTASRWVSQHGADIRLAPDARIRWVRADELFLLDGTVYVAVDGENRFAIDTPIGRVVDIGTRYQVRAGAQGVEVAVREGRVQLASRHGDTVSEDVEPGRAAVIAVDADGVSVSTESSGHTRWAWIHDVPAGYRSDEPLVLLREIARDLGKELRFASIGVEASLASERVDGDFSGMSPRQALQILGAATNMAWQEEGDVILVDLGQ